MIFNIISIVSFIVLCLLNWGLKKFRYSNVVIRVISIALFVYKSVYYVIQNIRGNAIIPIEISSISYFLIPIILTFKIIKLYNIASFLGIASGLGFFLFYSIAGFTVSSSFTITEYVISIISHGYLLTAGLQIMFEHKFDNKQHTIWLAMLGIISWAMAFFDLQFRGITFVYYIIKPTYLCITSSMPLNFLLIIGFYSIILVTFYYVVKLFFKVNNKIHLDDNNKKPNNYLISKKFKYEVNK